MFGIGLLMLNQPLAGDYNNNGFYFDKDEDTKAEKF